MMPHLLTPHEILELAKLPANQDRTEVRIYAAAMTAGLIFACLSPAFFILLVPASDVAITTRVTALPGVAVAIAFAVAALLALPHFLCLVCLPRLLGRREPRLMAIYGAIVAGITWLYLGVTVEPLDFGDAPWAYWAKAIACGMVAFIYALSLNSQQIRENDKPASID